MAGEAGHASNTSNSCYKDIIIENDSFPNDETLNKSQLLSSLNEEAIGELGKMSKRKKPVQDNQKPYSKNRKKDSPTGHTSASSIPSS